jgi:hypothetical protein
MQRIINNGKPVQVALVSTGMTPEMVLAGAKAFSSELPEGIEDDESAFAYRLMMAWDAMVREAASKRRMH